MTAPGALEIVALPAIPIVQAGDDLAALIEAGFERAHRVPCDSDVLVIAQKIISKVEGRIVDLADVIASPRAIALAAETGKDPRLVEVILSESVRVVRSRPGVLIMEHRLGLIMANAGVDQSNVEPGDGTQRVLLLPRDPDASAAALRESLAARAGVQLAIVINDSFGRAWRHGTAGVAIGAAGLPALLDLRGRSDLYGRALEVSMIGYADEIAAAASLLMGQAAEAQPLVLVRGLSWSAPACNAAALIRPAEEDLFR
jgi:coenzyme F420-0:L-glutamate ligase/coenzyme F420-1:gamma-L-glutamate ligase